MEQNLLKFSFQLSAVSFQPSALSSQLSVFGSQLLAQIPIWKTTAFSGPVIASACMGRGDLDVKGEIVKDEIASVPSQ